jgi:DNA-binding GntR family transcriptional regulator
MTIATIVLRSGVPSNGKMAIFAYQKIQSSIHERIEAGRLKPGDTVAPERGLARVYGVSLMTQPCACNP